MGSILVIAEHRKNILADISLQMLGKGRNLAEQSQKELHAVIIGKDVTKCAEELSWQADRVLVVRNNRLEEPQAELYQDVLAYLIREINPDIVLMGHSALAMDMIPSLSVELGIPLVTDCVDVSLQNNEILLTRSIYNGKINMVHSCSTGDTVIITGRIGEFAAVKSDKQGQIEEIEFNFTQEFDRKVFHGYLEKEVSDIDITQADVLISIGRGIKEQKNLQIAEELAAVLNGVISCSRPIVDYGWLPSERQVGLSGKTVKPALYLSLGISGAFQHVVGMKGSRITVAINKDASAPIFNVADYGIVDDILKVVPELVKKIAALSEQATK